MINEIKNKLISVLNEFCPDNIFLQGTLNPDKTYPAKFITFFITDSENGEHYDDEPLRTDLYFSVIFYSNNPLEVDTVPEAIQTALKAEGFIAEDAGNDVISDVPTHTGWATDYIYPFYK